MGPYLTVPRREKESVDGENSKVNLIDILYCYPYYLDMINNRNILNEYVTFRLNMEHAECKAGETQWKIHM